MRSFNHLESFLNEQPHHKRCGTPNRLRNTVVHPAPISPSHALPQLESGDANGQTIATVQVVKLVLGLLSACRIIPPPQADGFSRADNNSNGKQFGARLANGYSPAWLFLFFAFMAVPAPAHAGIFSFVADLFAAKPVVSEGTAATVQTAELLAAARNPDPNPAKGGGDITVVGGVALLPEAGPEGTLADIEENQAGTISRYVVREGDTLGAIAKMFGVSVNTVAWANDIRGGLIKPGNELIILPISGVKHKVVKGDTLRSIAAKYKADPKEIVQYNGLSEDAALAIGDVVIVPDGEFAPLPSAPRVTSPLRGAGGPSYDGYYIRPILGGRKTQGLHGYNGVDLASYLGAPILAAAAGEVIIARSSGWNGGYGNYIVITHDNGTQTLYSHLSNLLAYQGKRVVRGEIIGYMGATGRTTGVHLHFEVRGAKNPF